MTGDNEWSDFFDDYAPQYETNCFTTNTLAEVDFLIPALALPPGAALLDVGCGTGRHAIELARRGYDVTAVDASQGMLQQARINAASAGVQVDWHHAQAQSFIPPKAYDGLICLCEGAMGLLGSSDDPLLQPLAILRNVSQALIPQGRCLFTVLNGLNLIRKHSPDTVAKGAFEPLALAETSDCPLPQGPPLRERAFVPTELVLLFALAGLRVLHMGGGTAGNWAYRPLDLDEMEIMVLAQRPPSPLGLDDLIALAPKKGHHGQHP